MTSNLNNYGWDKSHYAYAMSDDGSFIGGHQSKEGNYHVLSNSWALLNKVAHANKLEGAVLKSLEKVNTGLGHVLLSPPYTKSQSEKLGRIADIAPGMFENGSIHFTAQAFVIYVLIQQGEGTRAWEEIKKMLPEATLPDISTGPLHQIPNSVVGPAHEKFGLHLYSNFTSAVTWLRLSLQNMVGVIPEFEGLRISPCIPNHWKTFQVKRIFRGNTYQINIKNPQGVQTGVQSVKVNNKAIEPEKGNFVIPFKKSSTIHNVEVLMGS